MKKEKLFYFAMAMFVSTFCFAKHELTYYICGKSDYGNICRNNDKESGLKICEKRDHGNFCSIKEIEPGQSIQITYNKGHSPKKDIKFRDKVYDCKKKDGNKWACKNRIDAPKWGGTNGPKNSSLIEVKEQLHVLCPLCNKKGGWTKVRVKGKFGF